MSPFIVMFSVLWCSIASQSFSGPIFILFTLAASALRMWFVHVAVPPELGYKASKMCDAVNYGWGSRGYSTFFLSFATAYMSMPMFINRDVNYPVFASLVFLLLFDIGFKTVNTCITPSGYFANIVAGLFLAVVILGTMYGTKSASYLMFNTPSDKVVCSVPRKQQFKCAVAKNGAIQAS